MIDKSPEPELPRGVALAWGIAANPQRGPKREMSIESIVDTAVDLADKGGLSAVSMSSVAAALGFTPMSLYRYVTAKDDLVLLMQERGTGAPPEELPGGVEWRLGLTGWANGVLAMFEEHPWMLDIPVAGTPSTPNGLAWLEAGLEVLDGSGLDYEAKISVILAVEAQVRWQGIVVRGYTDAAAAAGATTDDLEVRDASILEMLVTPTEFPFVHAAMQDGVFSPSDANPFVFGLERVLDGVEVFLAGRSREAPSPVDALTEQARRDQRYKEAVKSRREVEKKLREARKREREILANVKEKLSR